MKPIIVIGVAVVFCFSSLALAGSIPSGTISLSGGSTITYESSSRESEGDSSVDIDTYGLDMSTGYFVVNNLEIGLSARYSSEEIENAETTLLGLAPYVMYHLPVSDKANLIAAGQYGYFSAEMDLEDQTYDGDGPGFILSAGIEYFVIDSVALDCSLSYRRIDFEFDNGGHSVDVNQESTSVRFGVTAYFR